jgi:hypothetical protein
LSVSDWRGLLQKRRMERTMRRWRKNPDAVSDMSQELSYGIEIKQGVQLYKAFQPRFFFLWSVVLGFAFWRGFGFRTNSGGKVGANLRRKDNDLSAFVSWRILKRLFFFSFLNISALDSCEL